MVRATHGPVVDAGTAVLHGIVGGIVAGVVFIVGEMLMVALMGMPALVPLQMIGAIVLGPTVLPPAVPTVGTVVVGLIAHFVLSAIYGVILALVLVAVPALLLSSGLATLAGAVYGLALWLVNFYIIAPVLFPWFAAASPVVQFISHVLLFGAVLGYYLGQQLVRSTAEPT